MLLMQFTVMTRIVSDVVIGAATASEVVVGHEAVYDVNIDYGIISHVGSVVVSAVWVTVEFAVGIADGTDNVLTVEWKFNFYNI